MASAASYIQDLQARGRYHFTANDAVQALGERVTAVRGALRLKRSDPAFRVDVHPMLRSGVDWDIDTAMDCVLEHLIARLPGDAWKSHRA